MKILLALTIVLSLSACVSVSPNMVNNDEAHGTLSIHRSDQLQGSAVDVYVGWAGNYHVSLAPEEHTEVRVPAGLQTFQIRAHADLSNDLTLTVEPNERFCLIAEVNPDNIVGLNWFVPAYRLRQIDCLSDGLIKKGQS